MTNIDELSKDLLDDIVPIIRDENYPSYDVLPEVKQFAERVAKEARQEVVKLLEEEYSKAIGFLKSSKEYGCKQDVLVAEKHCDTIKYLKQELS